MANKDAPRGLLQRKQKSGAPMNFSVRPYYIPTTEASNLFPGDPVVITGTANTTEVKVTTLFKPGTLPAITLATAGTGNSISGVIASIAATRDDENRVWNPAGTEAVAYVCDDPEALFEMQVSGTGLAAVDVGQNIDVVYSAAGSTVLGTSGAEADQTTLGAGATQQLKVMRLLDREDNELGEFAKAEVVINNHTNTNNSAGV